MTRRLTGLIVSLAVLMGCGSSPEDPMPLPATPPTFTPAFAPTTDPAPASAEPLVAPQPVAPVGASGTPLLATIDSLTVVGETHAGAYSRDLFGGAWVDADGDGCTTRCEVLKAEQISLSNGRSGWLSRYDNFPVTDEAELDIDHLVPLAEAWRSGASEWVGSRRIAFANDLDEAGALIAVTAVTNRAKGDSDPADWKPANVESWCEYVDAWVATKRKWELTADPAEVAALRYMVAVQTC